MKKCIYHGGWPKHIKTHFAAPIGQEMQKSSKNPKNLIFCDGLVLDYLRAARNLIRGYLLAVRALIRGYLRAVRTLILDFLRFDTRRSARFDTRLSVRCARFGTGYLLAARPLVQG